MAGSWRTSGTSRSCGRWPWGRSQAWAGASGRAPRAAEHLQIAKRGGTQMQAKALSTRFEISSLAQALLVCGAVSGPLFIVAVIVQGLIVPGFDLRTDLISLLALSQYGWVQIANFTLCGVLNVLCAVGIWKRLHGGLSGTFAPIFVALHGLLL